MREEMAKAGHSVVLLAGLEGAIGRGYVRYLSDWHIWGGTGYVVFPLEGEPSLVLGSNSQAMWARRIGWMTDVRVGMKGPVEETLAVLKRHNLKGRLAVAGLGNRMRFNDIRALQSGLPGVELVDGDELFERVRRVKSDEEIANLTETSMIAAKAMRAFRDLLAPGRSERELVSEAWKVCRRNGVLDGIAHISTEDPPYVRPPLDRKIEASDIVKFSMEVAGPTGYQVELAAVFSFREPPEEQMRLFRTIKKAIGRIQDLMRPGVRGGDLGVSTEKTYAEDGWTPTTRIIWDAHGIGIDVIEPPLLLPEDDTVLEKNMALNVHPGLVWGDRLLGYYVQDNFVVSEGGSKPLSDWEHEWHVLKR
jgi:Xaa-Pro aminopeptidase